jgi:flagellar basal body rod protein FlgG
VTTNILATQELSYLSNLSAGQGYQVLSKNLPQAITNFEKTPQAQGAISSFEAGVAQCKTVSDFVNNPKLVDFVLSAFGLDSEDQYQGLIRQVLTQDPNSSSSLVNQLTDPRFKQLATALDFHSDGLGQLQAIGEGSPTSATSAEGVTLTSSTSKPATSTSSAASVTVSTTVNTNIAVGIGVKLSGNQYFAVQEPSGSTGYAQTGYFTIGSNGDLALADGSTLEPAVSVPSDTTSLSINSQGVIEGQEQGQPTPTVLGQLQVSSFANPSQLSTDSSGYLTPTTGSGAATATTLSSPTIFGATNQVQTTYNITPATSTSSSSPSTSGTVSIGLGVGGNEYLVLQKPDGSTVYAQSGYFTLNSDNQLTLPDGTGFAEPYSFPTGTTGVTITSSGELYAQVKGDSKPQDIGPIETATFNQPSALSIDKNGYATPTINSGSAVVSFVSNSSAYAFSNTIQGLVNDYVSNEFEVAVGNNNSAVREALYFNRTIGPDEKAAGSDVETQADVILGDSVLDNMVITAIGQPAQIAYQSLSSQESIIEKGVDLSQLQNSKYVAQFTAQYLAEYDASNPVGSSGTSSTESPALQILSAFGSSSSSSSSSSSILSLIS